MTDDFPKKPTSNIDETELARFEAMAPIWWDKQGDFKALHDINVLRLNYINDRTPLAGKAVVDAGCGGGILSEAMASLGAAVTGIDMGEAALGVARLHSRKSISRRPLKNLPESIRINLMSLPVWSCWSTFPIRSRSSRHVKHWSSPVGMFFLLPLTATRNPFCLRLLGRNIFSVWCAKAPTAIANSSNRQSSRGGP
jgi:SAM-dependent methyltransferase